MYPIKIVITLLIIFGAASLSVASDKIYIGYSPEGTPQFSNTQNDAHAVLFLQDGASLHKIESKVATRRSSQREYLIPIIRQTAHDHSMDPALLAALIDVESSFESTAISPKGAMGLMQLIPKTASQYGLKDPFDPNQNLDAGTRYLKDLLMLHNGNVPLAIAAYNAGQGSVSRYKRRIPPYHETLLYVPRVLAKLREYQTIFSERNQ